MRRLRIDAAVHFDVDPAALGRRARPLGDAVPCRGAFYLFHLISAKGLSPKTGMHSHYQQQVDLVKERFHEIKRGFRVERKTDAAAGIANDLQRLRDVM